METHFSILTFVSIQLPLSQRSYLAVFLSLSWAGIHG